MTDHTELEQQLRDLRGDYLGDGYIVINRHTIIDALREMRERVALLRVALEKISLFCPPDTTVDQLDESPEMAVRLHNAEIGDTARYALAATEPKEPTNGN